MLSRLIISFFLLAVMSIPGLACAEDQVYIPVLCYHNLNPSVPGSMTITPQKLESQIKWLKENGFTFISLKEAVQYLQGKRTSLPPKPIVITADDGWQSQYTYLYPLAKKYQIPVTLFIYPATISNGKHAMTWAELKELQQTGLFDIQGHTYWHPNFKQEKKRLSPAQYEKFVDVQLGKSRRILEEKMGKPVTLLAWPFGIYDPYLRQAAEKAGYEMAFSIDDRSANRKEQAMSQPRFMIIEGESTKRFANIANGLVRR